jgi:hypothetical protein
VITAATAAPATNHKTLDQNVLIINTYLFKRH